MINYHPWSRLPLWAPPVSTHTARHLDASEPALSGKTYRINCEFKEGISTENAKKIAKFLKEKGAKSLKTQIQGDELRVSSKSRDDLQTAIAQVKKETWEFAVQFTNYR